MIKQSQGDISFSSPPCEKRAGTGDPALSIPRSSVPKVSSAFGTFCKKFVTNVSGENGYNELTHLTRNVLKVLVI
jgi:hypothetical protein